MTTLKDILDVLTGIINGTEEDLTNNLNMFICTKNKEYALIYDKDNWCGRIKVLH